MENLLFSGQRFVKISARTVMLVYWLNLRLNITQHDIRFRLQHMPDNTKVALSLIENKKRDDLRHQTYDASDEIAAGTIYDQL